MTTEQLIANYSPIGDIITIITCLILMYIIAKVLFFSGGKGFKFIIRSLHFIMMGSTFNLCFYLTIKDWGGSAVALFVLRDLYHICFYCCLYCFVLYMKHMLDVQDGLTLAMSYVTKILYLCCLILDILSPVTKYGLHIENGLWYDDFFNPYIVYYVYSLVLLLGMLIFYSERIIRSVRTSLLGMEAIILLIMAHQFYRSTNTFTGFTYLLPIITVMIMLHSRPFDARTGSLSANTFEGFLEQTSKRGKPVDYMVLKLYLSLATEIPDELGKVLSSAWHDYFKNALLFEVSTGLYVLAIPKKEKGEDNREKIRQLVEEIFPQYYEEYRFTYKIIELFDIDFVENVSDVLGIFKYLLQNMEDNTTFVLDDKEKEKLQFYKFIRGQLKDIEEVADLDDPRVLVYCQPIRNMKTGKYDTAEALMRLSVPKYGFVPPGLFIEVAEEYDHIHILTEIMLNKVCKNIKELESEGYEFERISVNIAASEIREEGFSEEILSIIRDNGVNPAKIGIELTESQNEKDFIITKRQMRILREAGMTLYLDDVGTGYSNLDRIVRYDVDVVKFDRFFLMEAENSVKIIKMISHLAQAFQDMDYKLLYEGVETDTHEAICLNCGADYIQGFKYSKPVPMGELRHFFDKCGEESDKVKEEHNSVNPELDDTLDFTFKEMKDQFGILLTMSKMFYSMHIIDLVKNTVKPYNPTEDVKVVNVVNSSIGADQMMKQIMRMCTVDEYVDDVLKFSDLSTIAERMKGKKVYQSDVYVGKSIGRYVAAFFTLEADDEGRPTRVVYTTRCVEDEVGK